MLKAKDAAQCEYIVYPTCWIREQNMKNDMLLLLFLSRTMILGMCSFSSKLSIKPICRNSLVSFESGMESNKMSKLHRNLKKRRLNRQIAAQQKRTQ